MEINRCLFICFLITLLVGCDRASNSHVAVSDDVPSLHKKPIEAVLNTEEGYSINPHTRDSVNYLIDYGGDTVRPGQKLSVKHEIIPFDTNTRVIEMTIEPEIIQVESNTFDLGELKKEAPDSLVIAGDGHENSGFQLKNDRGEVIRTGRSFDVKGEKVIAGMERLESMDEIKQNPFPAFGKKIMMDSDFDPVISNVVEDASGNLWWGNQKLIRSNGVYYQSYLSGVEGSEIEHLMIGSKGDIWFKSTLLNEMESNYKYALVKFDGESFTYYSSEEELFFSEINKIFEDGNGTIWVGMDEGVLLKIQEKKFTYITPDEGLICGDINDIAESSDNELWLATNTGAYVLRQSKWMKFSSGPLSEKIHCIYSSHDENMWFGTANGTFIMKQDSVMGIDGDNGLSGSAVYQINGNKQGDVLIGSHEGVSILNLKKNSISHILPLESFTKNGVVNYPVGSVTTDQKGNFLVNIQGDLYQYPAKKNYERKYSLTGVRFIDPDGEKIQMLKNLDQKNGGVPNQNEPGFVTEKDGVVRYFSLKDISKTEQVQQITKVKESYWFLSHTEDPILETRKLFRLNGDHYEDFSAILASFDEGEHIEFYVDKRNVLWLAGEKNLVKYEQEVFKKILFPDFGDALCLRGMDEDLENNLWIGTSDNGIIKYDGSGYTVYGEREGLSSNRNTAATVDRKGNVWIETSNGINKFDGTSFKYFSDESGLADTNISDCIVDINNNVWVLTHSADFERRTLNLIRDDTNSEGRNFICHFSYEDLQCAGLGAQFTWNRDRKDRNIYMDWEDHVVLNADVYENIESATPNVQLNTILIDEQNYDFHNLKLNDSLGFRFDSVAPFYNYPENLVLDYDKNNLIFEYAATEWNAPNKIVYAHKLEGWDKKWSMITDKTSAEYRGLSPGNYTFKVVAFGESQKPSEVFTYSLRIRPPWWGTLGAKALYSFSSIALLFLMIRWRTAALRRRQTRLEREVATATKEISLQKAEIEKEHQKVLEAYERLDLQKKIVETKNREIMDSMTYAKRLQNAILPPKKLVKEWLNDSFILYKPKDIVAGDFYWMEVTKREGRNIIFYAAADCTGHGVPGAMVSVVCSNALNRAVKEFKVNDPAALLDIVSKLVQESFAKSDEVIRDGMDIAICAVDLVERKMWFAGANNPLYRITGNETKVAEELEIMDNEKRKLIEYKPDKQAIGDVETSEPFHTTEIQLVPGDCVYIFSDGFADQFGGDEGKKYKSINFKKFLLQIEARNMEEQREILDFEIEHWKGEYEQVDDICVIGLRINGVMSKIFTKRELEVIQKISEGKPSKIIAAELEITKNTVDTHRKRIMAKTNAHNSTELINFCKKHDIL